MYQTQSQFDQVEDGCLNEILLKEWVSLLVHRLDIMVGVAALLFYYIVKSLR